MGLVLNLPKTGPKTVDLTPAVSDFTQAVKEWTPRTNTMDLRVKYVSRNELPEFVFEDGQRPKAPKRKRAQQNLPNDSAKKLKSDSVNLSNNASTLESASITENAQIDLEPEENKNGISQLNVVGQPSPLINSPPREILEQNIVGSSLESKQLESTSNLIQANSSVLGLQDELDSSNLSVTTQQTKISKVSSISKKPVINLLK